MWTKYCLLRNIILSLNRDYYSNIFQFNDIQSIAKDRIFDFWYRNQIQNGLSLFHSWTNRCRKSCVTLSWTCTGWLDNQFYDYSRCTVRKINWWRYCLAQCDEMFDLFPLFDKTLRHIELCNWVIRHLQKNPPTLF